MTRHRNIIARSLRPSALTPESLGAIRPQVIGLDVPPLERIPPNMSRPIEVIDEFSRSLYKFLNPPVPLRFSGGAVVGTAQLQLLFWHELWQTAADPSAADVVRAVTRILDSPYLSELHQYGFQSLTMGTPLIVTPGPHFPRYSARDVTDLIWALIDDGRFPEPEDNGGRIIYMVFAPKGTAYEDMTFVGAHIEAGDDNEFDRIFNVDHAWVGWVNHGSLDDITKTFTHELVEIISDPEPGTRRGWAVYGLPETKNEIADVCQPHSWTIGGYAVSAYYSDRLKSCVVPGDPIIRSLSLSQWDRQLGSEEPLGEGDVTVTKNPKCFRGTYHWKLFGERHRATVSAGVSTYGKPEVTWAVNGRQVFSFPVTIAVAAETSVDPLAALTTLPEENATLTVVSQGDHLTIENRLGDPTVVLEVSCSVEDRALPFGFENKRTAGTRLYLWGRRREMDDRYHSDLNECLRDAIDRARTVFLNDVIPTIDKGDPIPPWVEKEFGRLGKEARVEVGLLRYLAHLVERVEPELAGTLEALATAIVVRARNTKEHATADYKDYGTGPDYSEGD